jgi:sterol desaturase/sphingolipid hydroxylase (fatty acid hydroxylase superfamily)
MPSSDDRINPKELLPRGLASNAKEYSLFPGYKLIGICLFFLMTYTPLHLGRTFSKELAYCFTHHETATTLALVSIIPFLVYTSVFLIMGLVYTIKHPFFEKFRSNSESWPWEKDPAGWPAERLKQLTRTYINITGLNFIVTAVFCYLDVNRWSTDFENLPSYPLLLVQVFFCYTMADFSFYWLHRLSHHPKIYWIHKHHHEALNTTVINSMSVHPLEWLFVDFALVLPGVILLDDKVHYVTLISFYLWLWFSNLDDHLGYDFPWGFTKIFPWSTSNTFHNYHHLVNIGNYAAHMVIWDSIFGTNKNFVEHFEHDEKNKKDKTGPTQIKLKSE